MNERRAAAATAAGAVLCVAFLAALLQPSIPNPFELEPATAWTLVCYAFAACILLTGAVVRHVWRLTPFDYVLLLYIAFVVVTWPVSTNRSVTGVALVRLLAQVAVFYAVRLLVERRRTFGLVIVAAMILGIAILEWTATDYHIRYGLSERVLNFASVDWNGREGLGVIGAVQFALLIGIWQDARTLAMQVASIVLIAVSIIEVLFFYSRLPYVAAAAALVAAMAVMIRLGAVRRVLIGGAIVTAIVAASATPYVVHLARRAAGLEAGVEAGPELRLELLSNARTIIGQHFFAGVGLGNFPYVHQLVFPIPYKGSGIEMGGLGHPHNAFVQQVAEVGIFGGIAYAALWATAIWAGWQVSTRRAAAIAGSSAIFYGVVAIVVSNIGENMFLEVVAVDRIRIHTLAWVLVGAVVAEWNRLRRSPALDDAA